MSRENEYARIQGDWRRLLDLLVTHAAAFAQLKPLRAQLAKQLDRAVKVSRSRAGLIASQPELSKQLWAITAEGQRLVTLLLSAIRQHYGVSPELGVQPFRGKTRKAKTTPKLSSPSPALPASPPW